MPPTDFASPEDVGRFVDVAARAGVDSFSSAGGVIVDDFDNDGQLDILTSNFDSCGQMKLFQRGPNGTFVDQAAHAGSRRSSSAASTCCRPTTTTTAARTCSSCAAGGSWRSGSRCCATTATARSPTSRLRVAWPNRPRARRPPPGPTSTTTAVSICSSATKTAPAQLFRNRGDGTFEDIAALGRRGTHGVHQGGARRRFRQRRLAGPLRLESARRELPVSQQPRSDVHRGWRRRPA